MDINLDINQISKDDKALQVLLTDGPKMCPTNPRWRTAAILKTKKLPYFRNSLTDFDEILHGMHLRPTPNRISEPIWRTIVSLF